MNNLRRLCMAVVLMLSLSAVALAGTIDCPGITQEPPTDATSETQSDAEAGFTVTEALLTLMKVIVSAP